MLPLTALLPSLIAAIGLVSGAVHAADQWYLFGRHGGCSEISELKRKLPDLPPVQDPPGLAAYFESKHMPFTRKHHQAPDGGGVAFQVPGAGLSLLLVNGQTCRAVAGGRP